MEYEKFVDYLKSQLELDMCDQDVTAERTMINKLNQDRDVLALRNPDSCITPVVYLDDAYYAISMETLWWQSRGILQKASGRQLRMYLISQRQKPKNTCIVW